MLKAILLSVSLVSLPAFSQTMYKCGTMFSQIPCGANAKQIEIKPIVGDVNCKNPKNFLSIQCKDTLETALAREQLAQEAERRALEAEQLALEEEYAESLKEHKLAKAGASK